MGRRALRKSNDSLDLSAHLFTPDHLPDPWNAAEWFGRNAPLVIEVGSGKGMFMVTTAKHHPELNLLGIEISAPYARYAAERLVRGGAEYARMIAGDAGPVFAERLRDNSVAAVHVYFPDPWWKRRHRRRRVMNETFVGHIERVLDAQGELHFWTDVADYFDVTVSLLRDATNLSGPLEVPEHTPAHDLDYRTNFERRMRKDDKPIYRSRFVKSRS